LTSETFHVVRLSRGFFQEFYHAAMVQQVPGEVVTQIVAKGLELLVVTSVFFLDLVRKPLYADWSQG
jgi:hypothetical protein